MDHASSFRRSLALRLLQAVVITAPPAIFAATGCSSSIAGGGGGAGGSTSAGVQSSEHCFDWPQKPDGGSSTASGDGGVDGSGGAGGSEADGGVPACPSPPDAPPYLDTYVTTGWCGDSIVGLGTYKPEGKCCYQLVPNPCTGRPFVVEAELRTAGVRRGGGETWHEARSAIPDLAALPAELRAILAEAWTRDGLMEHASVASFGRFALELMAVGAPEDLLEAAHRAAIDEVRHARLCLGLASVYAGRTIAPAAFPFEGSVEVDSDLASMAARAASEGCIGETLAAIQAAEQLAAAEDPAVRAALSVIAEDEARHAELAWRTVAWALREGGAPVREAVRRVFAEAVVSPIAVEEGFDARLRAHGRLSHAEIAAGAARALAEVVRPSAAALLGSGEIFI